MMRLTITADDDGTRYTLDGITAADMMTLRMAFFDAIRGVDGLRREVTKTPTERDKYYDAMVRYQAFAKTLERAEVI